MSIVLSDSTENLEQLAKTNSLIVFTDNLPAGYLYKPLAVTTSMCKYLQAVNNREMCEAVVGDFLSTPRAKRAFSVLKLMSDYCNILCICPKVDYVDLLKLYKEAFNANEVEVSINNG